MLELVKTPRGAIDYRLVIRWPGSALGVELFRAHAAARAGDPEAMRRLEAICNEAELRSSRKEGTR